MTPDDLDPDDIVLDESFLIGRIEALFAEAKPSGLRETTRRLEQLVKQVQDGATRRHYQAAIDLLPEMVSKDEAD